MQHFLFKLLLLLEIQGGKDSLLSSKWLFFTNKGLQVYISVFPIVAILEEKAWQDLRRKISGNFSYPSIHK